MKESPKTHILPFIVLPAAKATLVLFSLCESVCKSPGVYIAISLWTDFLIPIATVNDAVTKLYRCLFFVKLKAAFEDGCGPTMAPELRS